MKYKTLHEETEESWAEFEKTKHEKWEIGNRISFDGDRYDLNEYTPTSGCNLFHHEDVCKALISCDVPFTLNYWSLNGRERYCQFTIENKHNLSVFATGYGIMFFH